MNHSVSRRALLVSSAAALLASGCAGTSAVTGPYKVGRGYTVQLDGTWTDLSSYRLYNRAVRVLTVDGLLLNRLLVSDALAPGQSLVIDVSRSERRTTDKQIPRVRRDMTELELVEFVADSLAALDYQRIETSAVEPRAFGAQEGVGFRISGATPRGLDVSGQALAVQKDGAVFVMLFIAPSEHYFAALQPRVDRIFGSAAFPASRP